MFPRRYTPTPQATISKVCTFLYTLLTQNECQMDYHQVSKYVSGPKKGDGCWPGTRKGFKERLDLGLKTARMWTVRHSGEEETTRKRVFVACRGPSGFQPLVKWMAQDDGQGTGVQGKLVDFSSVTHNGEPLQVLKNHCPTGQWLQAPVMWLRTELTRA